MRENYSNTPLILGARIGAGWSPSTAKNDDLHVGQRSPRAGRGTAERTPRPDSRNEQNKWSIQTTTERSRTGPRTEQSKRSTQTTPEWGRTTTSCQIREVPARLQLNHRCQLWRRRLETLNGSLPLQQNNSTCKIWICCNWIAKNGLPWSINVWKISLKHSDERMQINNDKGSRIIIIPFGNILGWIRLCITDYHVRK